jgi:ABC-type glycerol-3-phosphate transport system substrate-binding protein
MIQTIVGKQSDFPKAPENWNYADFIAFYKEAGVAGYDYPFGQAIDRRLILVMLLFADDTFFCERTSVANFESEAFIDVLNFVMTIPADQGFDSVSHLALEGRWDPVGNLLRGEQLLLPFTNINSMADFRTLQTRLGGITAFGFPSNTSPTHAVQVGSGNAVGIRSNSPHIEAAWEFVRLGLIPGTSNDGIHFPLRIDLFEQLLYDEINRSTEEEDAGAFWLGGYIEWTQMTETDADLLRELVSNIGHTPIIGHPVQNIVNEDVQAFFAGVRSAEDTARIIQSRVQTLLAERER